MKNKGKSVNKYIIIDFDSTFLQVEALEELADIVLKGHPKKKQTLKKIRDITNLGVDGKITFNESLTRRLKLIKANREHLDKLVRRLKRKVSKSFSRNRDFFKKYKGQIYIISNGFKDFIDPVVKPYFIDSAHVLANVFTYNKRGWINGYDPSNLLAYSKGKSKTLKDLELDGEIYVIGDAYTDYEMIEAGIAHKFFMFTENVFRESILEKADHVTPSFDEFLFVNQMPMSISYPKNRIKVLLLDEIHEKALDVFTQEGYQVETVRHILTEGEFAEKIRDVSILGIRPKTPVTAGMLRHANRLMAVGMFGTTTTLVDLVACAEQGIIVFNAPYTNTRSLVELALAHAIFLLRRIPVFNRQMHRGQWHKTVEGCFESRGKKLGIVGYGNGGTQMSVLAEALGMQVLYYDVEERQAIGNATKCKTLKELLRKADVVTLHIDGRAENDKLFGPRAFKWMKKGSILINLSYGKAVDLAELKKNIRSGKLAGAAIDVFPSEPTTHATLFETTLAGLENVILTPHIGGNSLESQEATAEYVPAHIIDYINTGNTSGSVNFPELKLPALKNAHRLIHVHRNVPGIMAHINQTFARYQINIVGQYLKTHDHVGYVITDIDKVYDENILEDLKEIEHTIKFRVLY